MTPSRRTHNLACTVERLDDTQIAKTEFGTKAKPEQDRKRYVMRPLNVISTTALLGGTALIALAAVGIGSTSVAIGAAVPGIVIALAGGAGLTGLFADGYYRSKSRDEKTAIERMAAERGIEISNWARPESTFQSAIVVGGQGSCPLALIDGARWDVSPLGRLSMPLCKPAVEAVERAQAAREFGLTISTACVCPLGDQSVTFRLEPAIA